MLPAVSKSCNCHCTNVGLYYWAIMFNMRKRSEPGSTNLVHVVFSKCTGRRLILGPKCQKSEGYRKFLVAAALYRHSVDGSTRCCWQHGCEGINKKYRYYGQAHLPCVRLRAGRGFVSAVHGPVPQAGLPAADCWRRRRAASRTRRRDADRRSVSVQRRRVGRPRSRLLDRLHGQSHHEHPLHRRSAQRRRPTASRW